ncbi:MAG: sulfotransferase family protein [Paracoccaceae bacterium]
MSKSPTKPSPTRTAIVVLGMHRSGTSALAGALHLMGCDAPTTPMKPTEANEKGYFESEPIYGLHTALLDSAGSRWDDWLPINSVWYKSVWAEEYHNRAVELLDSEFGTSRLFVLKDPRICRLVPFWEDALAASNVAPRFVLTHRNPIEVANSLSGRDELNQGLGMLIWLRHVLDAEAATRGKPRCFVSYESLLANWAGTMQRIQDGLHQLLPRLSVGVAPEVEDFLDTGLRHHVATSKLAMDSPLLSDWVRDAYAVLEKWATETEDKTDYQTLDAVRTALTNASAAFAPVIEANRKAAAELTQARAALNETTGDRDFLRADQAEAQEGLASLRAELTQARAALNETTGDRDTLRADQAEAQDELASLRAELAQARNALEQRDREAEQTYRELRVLKSEQVDRDRRFAEMKASLDGKQKALESRIRSQHGEIAEISRFLQKSERGLMAKLISYRAP